MTHLDGNVLAGTFAELFRVDLTEALGRCAWCGATAPLAVGLVYESEMGNVLRCIDCGEVLLTVVDSGDSVWLSMPGISALRVAL
jgi:hypothetical protein